MAISVGHPPPQKGKSVMSWLMRALLFAAATVFMTISCASEDQDEPDTEDAATPSDGGDAQVGCEEGKALVDGRCVALVLPDLKPGWTRIAPEGETTCIRGDPYSFFVRPGSVNKLLVYISFGGFCYNALLCSEGMPNYVPAVEIDEEQLSATPGIFAVDNPENPFKDWYTVYVPDCTADFSWGDNVVEYPATQNAPAVTVRHKGFINATAVRHWIYENFSAPEQIVFSGSSGGGDAALMHYAYVRDHYDNVEGARFVYLADSSAGVTTDKFLTEDLLNWKAYENRPKSIPAIANASPEELEWDFLLIEGAKFYSDDVFAEFVSAYDPYQSLTYQIMGGVLEDWNEKMEAHLRNVTENAPNFRYFVVGGGAHIILDSEAFYGHQVDGTRFVNWVDDIVNGMDVPNLHCTECETEKLLYE